MKKGQRIGVNKAVGKSGEKYITWVKQKHLYKVIISTNKQKSQQTIGYSKTLEDAILMRDKYLSSL